MRNEVIPVGRPSVLRHANALNILKLLREAESCSRADLVRASGLSAPTVTNVVKDLIAEDLIAPLGEGESRGGRPPDMMRFKAERGCLLAVDIAVGSLRFLLTDLNGKLLEMQEVSLRGVETTPDAICELIGEITRQLLKRRKKTRKHLLVVVAGVPAITNVAEGVVLSISPFDGWRSVPLGAMLGKVFGCTVAVQNDTNLAALGERFCGGAKDTEDFVLISVEKGVGAGIVINGRIHYGSQWSAGEIGYLRLPHLSRRRTTLYEFGELEEMLCSAGIVKSWQEEGGKPSTAKSKKTLTAADVLDMALEGEPRAMKIVQDRAGMLADVILNLSLILNPRQVLLSGTVGCHPALLSAVKTQMEGSEFAVPELGIGTLGETAVRWGGISAALDVLPSVLLRAPGNS
ncbi:Sugar kinase of the NBD/HSP70 family, may contain an N-terminal HTH domain [Granulicella pectinivorans]|uniref:Sugar kinase of the NBD/HSP70 family, may contain an N-terminal HTH domain n=1 Tax=Granulicella pectinivorans TaxID=474950 RepID=A0A1I6MZF5_9BACT|nr:ROK family transcriptional regulator [Granulicella pectinivorans]SFS21073.1 Sugar kinase of the NBD/HSP70 family, may contain an N-terminal HTH domain [Granulicella pectinivorans]